MLNPKCTICKNILHCLVDTDVNIKGSFYTQVSIGIGKNPL